MAQNVWEKPQTTALQEEMTKKKSLFESNKKAVDPKYLAGAVPVVDGKVTFTLDKDIPGKSAQEIYDIRESRNMLSRGQAEFMPKDGEQLRIMMQGLNTQERALRQAFEGVTIKDTTEVIMTYVPTKEVEKELFFRFSKRLGFTDVDDLGGAPFYISIEVEQKNEAAPEVGKKDKDDIGLRVNMPAKIKATLFQQEKPISSHTLYVGQLGTIENLSGALFGRKQTVRLTLNPITGALESIKEENLQ
jgi:hypothetical protein